MVGNIHLAIAINVASGANRQSLCGSIRDPVTSFGSTDTDRNSRTQIDNTCIVIVGGTGRACDGVAVCDPFCIAGKDELTVLESDGGGGTLLFFYRTSN